MTPPLRCCILAYSLPVLASSLLLGGCSPASPPAATTADAGGDSPSAAPAVVAATQFPYGARVDSLDGLPGHRFGQPLSAFQHLKRGEGGTPSLVPYQCATDAARVPGWFARHAADVPGVFYKFKEGKFAAFQAVAYSPAGQEALSQEARFLFGPGRVLGSRTEWDGQKAWAILSDGNIYGRPVKVLNISSHTLLDGPSASEQARLKAENAN